MIIQNENFQKERELYNLKDATVLNCTFEGKEDGESPLKEARNVKVENCLFSLRYPFWHCVGFEIIGSELNTLSRAPLWYCKNGVIKNTTLNGTKTLRESENVTLENTTSVSDEFGWKCKNININNSQITSQYLLFESEDIKINNLVMNGKYSFQYTKNLVIENSELNTKDAFWHSENTTVVGSTVKGEYLGWYSKNLTLKNCKIIGTQPLCYCENLTLINCEMIDCDLAFEYSQVNARINGHITSVKNVREGKIVADSIGEIINEDSIIPSNCNITTTELITM